MAAAAATARSAHLQAASEALIVNSPATSAYLQSQQPSEKDTTKKPSKLHICPACSGTLIPDWNCKVTKPKRTRQDRLAGITGPQKWECSGCNTIHQIPASVTPGKTAKIEKPTAKKPDIPKSRDQAGVSSTTPTTTTTPSAIPAAILAASSTSTGAIIKKRTRSKKSSLQDMLANRKTAASSSRPSTAGFGLGLGDFVK